jgi:hypothetical protein
VIKDIVRVKAPLITAGLAEAYDDLEGRGNRRYRLRNPSPPSELMIAETPAAQTREDPSHVVIAGGDSP